MILEKLLKEDIDKFLEARDYKFFPKASEREPWEKVPKSISKQVIKEAEDYLNYEWPAAKAVRYMDFIKNGNRSEYEKLYHERLKAIGKLILGECIEYKGRFLDEIINAVWCICEQSSWSSPAHNGISKRGKEPLPDIDNPVVTLSSSEIAATLSWTYYLLREELDDITPIIGERIKKEIRKRIVIPYINDFYWWMGLSGESFVNNWNPWCNSNCIIVLLLIDEDMELRKKGIIKAAKSIDRFLDTYSEEGGCDEGSSYWGRAGGSLFDCLELFYTFSKGKINFYNEPIIKAIGSFIYKTHIDKDYFINFADGSAKVNVDAELIYRYGKRIQDDKLESFGAYMYRLNDKKLEMEGLYSFYRALSELFNYETMYMEEITPDKPKDIWFKDIQVMAAREDETNKGFFIAAKGGHNGESHNHNDIGQFVLYYDGSPLIIDIGVETYSAKTFSDERYDIWTMQSAYHNLPIINGYQQKHGESFKAEDIEYCSVENEARFSLDISKAYEKESDIISWTRTLLLNRTNNSSVQLVEDFKLGNNTSNIIEVFMTCCPIELKDGIVLFKSKSKDIELVYDNNLFEVDVEEIHINDEKLRKSWDKVLRRILLKSNKSCAEAEWKFTFRAATETKL